MNTQPQQEAKETMPVLPGFLAKKVGMTQIFDESGFAIPVTVLEVLENVVTQVKSQDTKDGYDALQVGGEDVKRESRLTKNEVGHLSKNDLPPFRHLKEYRVTSDQVTNYKVGDKINIADIVGEAGDLLDITSRPKGKGTMGAVVRWNNSRRLMTHGTKHHRQIGSAGPGTTPGRVFPGKKMPGRENKETTMPHLELVKYCPEENILVIKGSVAGHKNSLVSIQKSKPVKGWNKYGRSVAKRPTKAGGLH